MKPLDSNHDLKLTYGELASVLSRLGFEDQSTAKECVFFNEKHNILFKLGKKPSQGPVFHLDLMGITFHLAWNGLIEDREDLWKLVEAQKKKKK